MHQVSPSGVCLSTAPELAPPLTPGAELDVDIEVALACDVGGDFGEFVEGDEGTFTVEADDDASR